MLKKYIKSLVFAFALFCAFAAYISCRIPDNLYFTDVNEISIKSIPVVTLETAGITSSRAVSSGGENLRYTAKLFGAIPIKNVNVSLSSARKVAVAGTPFGIKMFSDGVMVVGFSDIETPFGCKSPAREADIRTGDIIIKFNNTKIENISDVESYLKVNKDRQLQVVFLRDNVEMTADFCPVLDITVGEYRTGMWVRDSSAGVGTMTFYDVQKGMFAGLGHGIKDADTQKDIRLLSGEIVPVKIMGVTKSRNGQAGELKGTFVSSFATGQILANSTNGVYGNVFSASADNMMEVASPQEIQTGEAYIITTINGDKAKKYNVVIEKIALGGSNHNKNMVIRITDPELLAVTGGIVQGMSGSPIVQNGKLVGAITHVFVNQVERGYGVFAQNMLDSLDNTDKVYNKAQAG